MNDWVYLALSSQVILKLKPGTAFWIRLAIYYSLVLRNTSIILMFNCIMGKPTSMICRWRSDSYWISTIFNGRNIVFLFAFWWYDLANIIRKLIEAFYFCLTRFWLLNSNGNLISLLFPFKPICLVCFIKLFFSCRFLWNDSIFKTIFDDRIVLHCGILLCVILLDKILEQFLNCIGAFWVQILWFFHLLHL